MVTDGVLTVKDLCFRYDKNIILKDLCLDAGEGEAVILLGPNGCGKTTLLDCIIGYHKYESGSITLCGTDDKKYSLKDKAKMVAYVPQSSSNKFPYTVFEIVLMGRTPYLDGASAPGKEDEEKALSAIENLGLLRFKDRNFSSLSGGEKQLVMIARALAQDSSIVLFDEPTSSLDLRNEAMVLKKIIELAGNTGKSSLIATHHPNHAFYLERNGIPVKVALFADKRIKYFGTPSEVLTEDIIEEVYGVGCGIYEYASGCKIIVVN